MTADPRTDHLEARVAKLEADLHTLALAHQIDAQSMSQMIDKILALEAWAKETNP